MKFFKLITLLLSFFTMVNSFAGTSKNPEEILTAALKKSKSSVVDYSSGCSECIMQMMSRPKAELESPDTKKRISLTILSENEVNKIFKELSLSQNIPFGFPFDGCYARAAAMAKLLDDKGIQSGKAFVEGKLAVDTKEFGTIEWRYHVAPVVLVKIGNKNIPYVIDPSIMDKAVPFETWKSKMLTSKNTVKTVEYFTNRFVYGPDDRESDMTDYDQELVDDAVATNKHYTEQLARIRKQKNAKQ